MTPQSTPLWMVTDDPEEAATVVYAVIGWNEFGMPVAVPLGTAVVGRDLAAYALAGRVRARYTTRQPTETW